MPRDVLDHDDGVVDQDADGEDQREQAHPVDGVAHDPGGEEREQDRGRDHDDHDDAFAPADREHDQEHDGDRREPQVEQQFVGLVAGRRAVVARDLDLDVVRQGAAAQLLKFLDELRRDIDRVGACPLGDGDRDGGNAHQLAIRVLC